MGTCQAHEVDARVSLTAPAQEPVEVTWRSACGTWASGPQLPHCRAGAAHWPSRQRPALSLQPSFLCEAARALQGRNQQVQGRPETAVQHCRVSPRSLRHQQCRERDEERSQCGPEAAGRPESESEAMVASLALQSDRVLRQVRPRGRGPGVPGSRHAPVRPVPLRAGGSRALAVCR